MGPATTGAVALAVSGGLAACAPAMLPLRLHPDNPRYFEFRGRPTVLVTSGEHYGAVLNLDFDYPTYLDELHRHGLNLTRTFAGMYCESWGEGWNTLNPAPGRPSLSPTEDRTASGFNFSPSISDVFNASSTRTSARAVSRISNPKALIRAINAP